MSGRYGGARGGRGACLLLPLVLLTSTAAARAAETLTLEVPGAALAGAAPRVEVTVPAPGGEALFLLDGRPAERRQLQPGQHQILLDEIRLPAGTHLLSLEVGEQRVETELRTIPGWLSVLPPVIAIGLALVFKDVLVALFAGIFAGALFLNGWNPLAAFGRTIDHFVLSSLADPDHASILIFSGMLGAMVGVISRSGGTQGIVEWLRPYATNARRGQLATWAMGVMIFFDDYANTLIVGSTMRPVTDRLRISREKLAYIVDSTAAPVACIIPVSTWVGFEVGLISGAFSSLDLPLNPYATFLASLPYRFYPILALVLVFSVAVQRRDFGPMLRAERRARTSGKLLADGAEPLANYSSDVLEPPHDAPKRAYNAFLPMGTVIGVTLAGLLWTGSREIARSDYASAFKWLQAVLSNADSYSTLLWGSVAGAVVALSLAVGQRILSVRQSMEALVEGFKSMVLALMVLVLAWSIGGVCTELHTADYLVALTEGFLSPYLIPALVFLLAAAIAFATGSSWGTMAILTPLVIPIGHGLAVAAGHAAGDPTHRLVMIGAISSVLAGSVWGDHCSPISDTTILSSMSSGCDHIAHVRTQLPYALSVAVLGIVIGNLPTVFGLSPWISLAVGVLVIVLGTRFLGSKVEEPGEASG